MKIYLLGNIADVQTGPFGSQLHKEDYVEFGTPMVTVEHLGNRVFTKQNLPMISDSDKKRLNKYVLNEGDIVFSRVGSVDRCSYVDNKHLGWMFSGRCLRIRPRNVVYPLYLYYYFCMENTKQFIRNIAVGATMPSINTKLMEDLKVPLPTMEMQQKIASILSALDDKIALNNRINENLESQAQAIFKDMIADVQEQVPFTSIIQVFGGGTPKTSNQEYWNGKIPFFTPKDTGNPYVLTTEKNITPLGLNNCNSRLYPVNTVFLTARGTVGKVSLAGVPMSMNQSCYALVGKDGIHQIIVYHYVLETVKALKHKASGAVFDAIITRDFDTERVPALSSEQINGYIAVAEPIYNEILNRTLENKRLEELRDTLLPKLMNGEIDVSEVKI